MNPECARKLHAALTIELGFPLSHAAPAAVRQLLDDGAIALGEMSAVYCTPEGKVNIEASVVAFEGVR